MFHKIKNVSPLPDFKLRVQFCEGITKLYDMNPLFEKLPVFASLRDNPAEFDCVSVDVGGYGIIWGGELDLSCGELWGTWNRDAIDSFTVSDKVPEGKIPPAISVMRTSCG